MKREGSVSGQKGREEGGAASPSGRLSFLALGRKQGRTALLPPKEVRVDRQLARNGDSAGLKVGGQH